MKTSCRSLPGGAELDAAGVLGASMMGALTSQNAPYSIDDIWEIEFEVEFITGLSTPLQELWKEIRGGNRSPSLDLVRQATESGDAGLADVFVDVVRILNPRNIVENAVTSTACTLATIELLGGSADVLCASPLMGKLIFPAPSTRHREPASTSLPGPPSPTSAHFLMSDLIAIRHASEALGTWRADLAAALDYANRARRQGVDSTTIQTGIAEMVAEARVAFKQRRGSPVLSRQNLVSFVAGAIGGAGAVLPEERWRASSLVPLPARWLLWCKHSAPIIPCQLSLIVTTCLSRRTHSQNLPP